MKRSFQFTVVSSLVSDAAQAREQYEVEPETVNCELSTVNDTGHE